MNFISTRGGEKVGGAKAIVQGLSSNGGLFVPEKFPVVDAAELEEMLSMSYAERAAKIIHKYLDEYDYDGLLKACEAAYSRFEGDPAPLVKIDDGVYILELFHGPTCAFKDMALTLLPYLLKEGCRIMGIKEDILILVATSGDTGKAALEGFRDAEGVKIMVFYPNDGVSKMQKLQMCTQDGSNVNVVAVKGNFDDCQTAVKGIFNSAECAAELKKRGYLLSSANSINFGRLVPQVVYYFSAYLDLVSSGQIEQGTQIDFSVPTGNFGNILAAYYAKLMGLPVRRLHCASNMNNILTDFLAKGEYDTRREFYKTTSPSMDILISSNLERLLFEVSGRDAALTAQRMQALKTDKVYRITPEEQARIAQTFDGGWADEDETRETIATFFDLEEGYVLDPHTAVAVSVYNEYSAETEDMTPAVIVSTASPYKFACDVYNAVAGAHEKDPDKAVMKLHTFTAAECPDGILALNSLPVRHASVIPRDGVKQAVYDFVLGERK